MVVFFASIVTLHEFVFFSTAEEVVYKWHVVTVTAWPWFKTKNPWRNMSTPGVWAHLVSWAFLRSSCRTTDGHMFSLRGVLRREGCPYGFEIRHIVSWYLDMIWYSCLVHCVLVLLLYCIYHVRQDILMHHPFTSPVKQDRKFSLLPQKVRLDPNLRVVSITSGPLAHHSFLLLQRNAPTTPTVNGYPMSNGTHHPSEGS